MGYFCLRFHSIACSVNLYCWRGCLGISGYLHSIAPSARAIVFIPEPCLVLYIKIRNNFYQRNVLASHNVYELPNLVRAWYELGSYLFRTKFQLQHYGRFHRVCYRSYKCYANEAAVDAPCRFGRILSLARVHDAGCPRTPTLEKRSAVKHFCHDGVVGIRAVRLLCPSLITRKRTKLRPPYGASSSSEMSASSLSWAKTVDGSKPRLMAARANFCLRA